MLAKSIIKLAEEKGVSKKKLQQILQQATRTVNLRTGEQLRYDDLLKGRIDVDFVVRMERKNDIDTISNKTFDFSTTTIRELIQDGYQESKEAMKKVVAENA